ncbi:MAG: excinuclease ABC subunit UvrB [bacterium]
MSSVFSLESKFQPAGDQPEAIDALCRGLDGDRRFLTLEGVTGSGKTFTMANVIARTGLPTLLISHNKTLAAQLFGELKAFFPANAVEFFISYYDYYQPEAYIPQTDTHIEKDASINEAIERMRLSATNSVLARRDVIIIASVSCIYGLGSPEDYREMTVQIANGMELNRDMLLRKLVDIQYSRNDYETSPGTFRVRGDAVDIFPSYSETGVRVSFWGETVESIRKTDPTTGNITGNFDQVLISPARHFVMPEEKIKAATTTIVSEMEERVKWFEQNGKLIEAQRIKMRTMFDVEMMRAMGYCSGIENYSRHLSGRPAGAPPATLLDYFPKPFLTIIDESHVSIPQLKAMYNGDQSRKSTLVDYGFRLPSAKDNRPLCFDEFLGAVGKVVFTTATPGPFELEMSGKTIEQVVRPTGLLDPPVEVHPTSGQIDHLIEEVRSRAARKERVLVTTLTKRTAEDLSEYMTGAGLKVRYLHSEIGAFERVEILNGLRNGDFDCLVGINLLREGLDLPEVSLVAILDADKEGFLRSETSLLQTAGRTARHVDGKVIMYADVITESMRRMINVTEQRRLKQLEFNKTHGITPKSIEKVIRQTLKMEYESRDVEASVIRESGVDYDIYKAVAELRQEMLDAAGAMEFERAAMLRDEIRELERDAETHPSSKSGPRLSKRQHSR